MSNIQNVSIENEMTSRYLDYAMSVIVSRALPDVRDGLKPVHRRILYSMFTSGCYYNRPYKKSARIVGEVMGKYHPHGDQAIYDALVRMAQEFSLRVPLIDGQGNFGSIDRDEPAAMRYTESRLTKITHTLLEDLEKDTVSFVPNYDGSEQEPSVLPATFPNLLVNGSEGIAVGMATSVPTHNLTEVINATIAYIKNRDLTVDELLTYIPAPDFPTGGILLIGNGMRQAAETGRGMVKLRGRALIESMKGDRQRILITEIPYQVVKASLVENVAALVRDKKLEGISDIRDESNKEGIRIVLDLKKGVDGNIILNQLYKLTQLQININYNILALNKGFPEQMSLKAIISAFTDFREQVVSDRTKFLLNKAKNKAHLLIGLTVAVDYIDRVVQLIRSASDQKEARRLLLDEEWRVETENLRDSKTVVNLINLVKDRNNTIINGVFKFTEQQVNAVLEMRLSKLTGLERNEIVKDLEALAIEINEYTEILHNRDKFIELIINELETLKKEFYTPRKTEISFDEDEIDIEDLIQKEDVIISFTLKGYIQRESVSAYETQKRGGKGKKTIRVGDDDCITDVFTATTHSPILFFTDKGRVYQLKAYKIPAGNSQSKGRAIVNLLNISNEEKITNVLVMPDNKASWSQYSLIFATKQGLVRKSPIEEFETINSNGKIAIGLNEGDGLVGVKLATEDHHILLASSFGQAVRFSVASLRIIKSRNSTGVIGMDLEEGDSVISVSAIGSAEKDIETRDKYLQIPLEIRSIVESLTDEELKAKLPPFCTLPLNIIREWAKGEEFLLTVTENGYGKCSSTYEYRISSRGGKGVKNIETSERNGNVIGSFVIHGGEDIIIISSSGKMVRCSAKSIPILGRVTQGVRIMRLDDNEKIISLTKVSAIEEESEALQAEIL